MVEVAARSIEDAAAQLDLISASAGTVPGKDEIDALYDTLLGATAEADGEAAPLPLLASAVGLAAAADESVIEALAPRARVALRLLRLDAAEAAWLVLIDNATGVVPREFRAGTSSGADRTDWQLPLLTAIEPPEVYAELPGFRDPRHAVPDSAYEIGAAIKLRCHVDEIDCGPRPVISGWAALDLVTTEPEESVSLVVARDDVEIRWSGVRRRRADLVGGSRDSLRRRAWAGWSVVIDPGEVPADGDRWMVWLELTHNGLVRRARLGRSVGEVAARATTSPICDRPPTELVAGPGGWLLQRLK